MQEQLLLLNDLLKQNQFDQATEALSKVDADQVLRSSESIAVLHQIEGNACRLLKDEAENGSHALKFTERMGLLNRSIATTDADDVLQAQTWLLLDSEIVHTLGSLVDTMVANDEFHHHEFVLVLCVWLESIGHFVHRHDNVSTDVLVPLRKSLLSCVLSKWYEVYLLRSSELNSPVRHFFVRTCSLLTGILQCSQLSFENALKTAQSYSIVIGIGEQIFARHLAAFRQYLMKLTDFEVDSACLTGVCFLMTNCYLVESFRADDAYFTLLLRLLQSDFVRAGVLPTWNNDSTILADTIMVQLKNATNDSAIRLYLQQSGAAKDIYSYIHASYDRLRLQACMLLGVLLDDTVIQKLQIQSDQLTDLYFDAIQQAHRSKNKCYRRVPVHMLLKALAALVHNDAIQVTIANSANYFDYLVSVSDDYNIIYDILWTLSFSKQSREKFNSHEQLLSRLRAFVDQPKSAPDRDIALSAEGILWNLTDRKQAITIPDSPSKANPSDSDLNK